MTINEFIYCCESYEYSKEYFDTLKECATLSLAEKYLENINYVSENYNMINENREIFTEGYFQESSGQSLLLEEEGVLSTIWSGIKKVFSTIIKAIAWVFEKLAAAFDKIDEVLTGWANDISPDDANAAIEVLHNTSEMDDEDAKSVEAARDSVINEVEKTYGSKSYTALSNATSGTTTTKSGSDDTTTKNSAVEALVKSVVQRNKENGTNKSSGNTATPQSAVKSGYVPVTPADPDKNRTLTEEAAEKIATASKQLNALVEDDVVKAEQFAKNVNEAIETSLKKKECVAVPCSKKVVTNMKNNFAEISNNAKNISEKIKDKKIEATSPELTKLQKNTAMVNKAAATTTTYMNGLPGVFKAVKNFINVALGVKNKNKNKNNKNNNNKNKKNNK